MNEKLLEYVARATKIYYGKDHHCRCGCGGRYAKRGERTFKTYVTKLKKAIEGGLVRDPDTEHFATDGFVNIPVGERCLDRCYCLYFDND